jgi:hypothetical protein
LTHTVRYARVTIVSTGSPMPSFSTTDFSFTEDGFCREYTAAAKTAGMTDEQIATRDRLAAQGVARDRLMNTHPELVTPAMVAAAGLTPADWLAFTGQVFEDTQTVEPTPLAEPCGLRKELAAAVVETVSNRDARGRKSAPAGCIEIARRMNSAGASLREISGALAEAGFLSPSGKAYWPASIQKMIGT